MPVPGLSLNENHANELVLTYTPVDGADVPRTDPISLLRWVEQQGYAGWKIDENALRVVVQAFSQEAGFSKVIGQKIDAHYDVTVVPDRLTAYLKVSPAWGGKAASPQDAVAALQKEGISFGLDAKAVLNAVRDQIGEMVLVAQGRAPEKGKDAWFEPLVSVNRERHPRMNEKGEVDLRDLGVIPTVAEGAPVMQRHPATLGVAGKNVLGEDIPPPPGKDTRFGSRLQGVMVDPENPNLLRAVVAGQPVLLRDGVNIEPVVKMAVVDISTGNVDFVGSLTITGDVQSGMKIKVGGDVTVEGTIEAADIEAGGNIIAKGGIIGQGAHGEGDAPAPRIRAKGNIRARYVENAILIAEQSVYISETLINSDVMAMNRIEVGKKGTKKGYIMGGYIRATQGVSADFLGGPGSGHTRVSVGVNPLLQQMMEAKKQAIAAKVREHADLSKLIKLLQEKPDKREMLDRARNTLRKVSEEISAAMEEERALLSEAKLADQADIAVREGIFGGTTVTVGRRSKFIAEDCGRGVFRLTEGQLVYAEKKNG